MTLQYISSDKSINLTLNYIRTRTLKMYPGVGKTFPLTTQCVIIDNKNGLVVATGTVIKHEREKEDNNDYAVRLATKKAIGVVNHRFIRDQIWDLLNKELKKSKQS